MRSPPTIRMRGQRWILSLDAESFASLYAIVLLSRGLRWAGKPSDAQLQLEEIVIQETERIKSLAKS